jgi:hypothetical protein
MTTQTKRREARTPLARTPTRRDGGLAVGKVGYAYSKVINPRLFRFLAQTRCLRCEAPLVVEYGTTAAALKIGNELVGVVCDACLTPDAVAQLTEYRAGLAAPLRGAGIRVFNADAGSEGDDPVVRP